MFFPQWVIVVLLASGPQTGTITDPSGNFTDEKACLAYAVANGPRMLDWVRGRMGATLHTPGGVISSICTDKLPAETEPDKVPDTTA